MVAHIFPGVAPYYAHHRIGHTSIGDYIALYGYHNGSPVYGGGHLGKKQQRYLYMQ